MCGKREASLHPQPTSEDIIQPVGKVLPCGGPKEGHPPRMGSEGLHCAGETSRPFWGRGMEGQKESR